MRPILFQWHGYRVFSYPAMLYVGTVLGVLAGNRVVYSVGLEAFRVWIESEHPTTVPLGVPDEGSGFLKSVAGSLITIIVYSLLH